MTTREALSGWTALNTYLRGVSTSAVARALLDEEERGACRRVYLLRIHRKFNLLRGREERAALEEKGMLAR